MTSVTTSRVSQIYTKQTIIILLRTVYFICVCVYFTPTKSLRHVTKMLRYHHWWQNTPNLSNSEGCKIDPNPQSSEARLAGAEKDNLESKSVAESYNLVILWPTWSNNDEFLKHLYTVLALHCLSLIITSKLKPQNFMIAFSKVDICFHTQKSDSH